MPADRQVFVISSGRYFEAQHSKWPNNRKSRGPPVPLGTATGATPVSAASRSPNNLLTFTVPMFGNAAALIVQRHQ
jgi:hypothetical protein